MLSGAKVRTASGGAEALQIVGGNQFDVIISDVSMPGMDGFEFLRRFREQPQYLDVPVLALTGFGRPEDIERAKKGRFLFAHHKTFRSGEAGRNPSKRPNPDAQLVVMHFCTPSSLTTS